ncbi:MAG: hypothetical protein CSA76_00810 [Spirochaetales bacterium]|nr:MAG: hypothetical protein CSA76_00810 [Spirochaetales bacterium]
MSRVCLCLTAPTLQENLEQLEKMRGCVDMAELRVDMLRASERYGAAGFPAKSPLPLILTVRLAEDGGRWGIKRGSGFGETETEREKLFIHILESGGWAYADLEANLPLAGAAASAEKRGTRIIRSIHNFQGDWAGRSVNGWAEELHGMAAGGVIPKLALHCRGSRDVKKLAELAGLCRDVPEKVLLGMGEYGIPTRILAERMGSLWTYAAAPGGNGAGEQRAAAPGQLDAVLLNKLYQFSSIAEETPLYGILGNPVAHSRSPQIHNAWLREQNLPGTYLPLRADNFQAALETCRLWGFRGLSVTVPHKEKALSFSASSSGLARRIGAANTLLREGNGWRAENTDAPGFLGALAEALALEDGAGLAGMRALVIGAGGAARAAVHALNEAGVNLVILNRTAEKAAQLAGEVNALWGGLGQESAALLEKGIDLAVQTTPAGMAPLEHVNPLPWWNFAGCRLAFDMIYTPAETLFLSQARKHGIKTANGLGMLERQARLQFNLFKEL